MVEVERSLFGSFAQVPVPLLDVEMDRLESSAAYVIRSFLSLAFLRPPNAILVPGMYFFGFSRYSNYVTS